MKLEDIKVDFTTKKVVDESAWNKDEWIKEHPIDYFKYMAILLRSKEGFVMTETFNSLYKVSRLYLPRILYKYYSLSNDKELNNKKLKTIENKKLYMSDLKDFNDPFDGKGFYYRPEELADLKRLSACNGRLIDDFSKYVKCTSLTSNGVHSMPMWAHYGSNHTGFCISYDLEDSNNIKLKSGTFPVQYINERVDITTYMKKFAIKVNNAIDNQSALGRNKVLIEDVSILYMMLLFINLKHITWNYEKEFRCTFASNAPGSPFIDATPKEVFIGMDCDSYYVNKLKSIANKIGIPVYKMKFDELADTYELIPVSI